MCGVFIAFSKKQDPLDINKCRLSLDKMSHRGPDYKFESIQFNDRLYMGQTILSITGEPDKKLTKYQISKNKRFNLVLNGEIYNYQDLADKYLDRNSLKTGSDAEVLVNLYEKLNPKKLASELDGMYAYCVYDRQSNNIFVGRDLIGEKVLYRYEDENNILFASEIATLINFNEKYDLNLETIHEYFFSRHLLANHMTEFSKIQVFPPGKTIRISLMNNSEKTVHEKNLRDIVSADEFSRLSDMSESEILSEFDSICQKTAKKLAPDVNYASVFSGGVDSSLASWYMLQEDSKPSLLIGLVFNEKDQVSKQLDLFQEKIDNEILSKFVSEDLYLKHMSNFYRDYKIIMPTHSFVSQMILSEEIRNHNCKVLIGGDGADELFGGYELYKNFKTLVNNNNKNISPYSGFVESEIGFKYFEKENLLAIKNKKWTEAFELFSHIKNSKEKTLQTALFLDSLIEMETVGLRSSDLMSMANSVESRSFYVTHEMLKFSINLPIKYKINFEEKNPMLVTKPLLKKAFIKCFGEKLLFQKQGFSGYPNESAELILKGNYINFNKQMNPLYNSNLNDNQSLKWKIMNVELFLRSL